MVVQLVIGTVLILATVVLAALGFWAAEASVTFATPWLLRRPHAPKLAIVLLLAVVMVLAVFTVSVWIWALTFRGMGLFITLEASVYFSIVAFTTLGFGDILLPQDWRILGGLAAANGLLNMGLYTAMLVEILRRVRSQQAEGTADEG